jgi:prefoldin subunit 5
MPPATAEQELQSLQEQSRYFSEALEDVKKRIDELSREKKS